MTTTIKMQNENDMYYNERQLKRYGYKTENHSYKYIIKLEPETWKKTLKEILAVVY